MIIAILGRQPLLGLAELESRYGASAVLPVGEHAAQVDATEVELARLGGTVKLAKMLTVLPTTDWRAIGKYLADHLPEHLAYLPEGKLKLGLSVYGLPVTPQQLFRTGLELKKICRQAGRSVRLVPNTEPSLNSAQVAHNQLTGPLGWELVFIKNGRSTWLVQTTAVQDVDDYARRDYGRPKRDAFVGMLPPKLAQIMLNLAQVQPGQRILDPFCGTGVVLQEAALAGCKVYGTDIAARMIDYSRENLNWLASIYNLKIETLLEVGDATDHRWQSPITSVVGEVYLGQPLSGLPKPQKLAEIIQTCNTITEKFLKNLRPQLAAGTRLCLALPAWYQNSKFTHLPLLDHLSNLGYNRLRFTHIPANGLIYHRKDQIVARELLIITVI